MAHHIFMAMSAEQRRKQKAVYERLLSIEEDRYVVQQYPPHSKFYPRMMPYPTKMPWMYKAWCEGYQALREVMLHLGEYTDTTGQFELNL